MFNRACSPIVHYIFLTTWQLSGWVYNIWDIIYETRNILLSYNNKNLSICSKSKWIEYMHTFPNITMCINTSLPRHLLHVIAGSCMAYDDYAPSRNCHGEWTFGCLKLNNLRASQWLIRSLSRLVTSFLNFIDVHFGNCLYQQLCLLYAYSIFAKQIPWTLDCE